MMDQTKRDKQISTQFIAVYNRLDGWMRSTLKQGKEASFSSILKEMATGNSAIDKHLKFLQDMGDVRNLVVHTRMGNGVGLAVPTHAVVDEFSRIAGLVMDPPSLFSNAAKTLKVHRFDDPLTLALNEMKEHDFSQLVVQGQNGAHRLITREGIAKWLEESIEDDVVSIAETTIVQVLHCEDTNAYCFLPRDSTVYEGLQVFADPKKRIQALILTQNGRESEKPLGLVTAHDIARIALSSL